jgi:Fur family peroxide stress response transcriptional regulator
MNSDPKKFDDLVTRVRKNGFRLTKQRMAVLKTLAGNKEHLSAEELFERVKTDYPLIGLATVYKTIAMLKDMGEITEININNDSARYDGRVEGPHPHFVCTQCNSVQDLDDIIEIEHPIIDNISKSLIHRKGFKIENFRLNFFGSCPNCQSG